MPADKQARVRIPPRRRVSYAQPTQALYPLLPIRIFLEYERLGRPAPTQSLREADLWKTLAICVLSSQTRYEHALANVEHLELAGILDDLRRPDVTATAQDIVRTMHASPVRPRFWRRHGHWLFDASRALYQNPRERTPLERLRGAATEPTRKRRWLADTVPGLGPKQASHYLATTEPFAALAILDHHVLAFLADLRLVPARPPTTVTQYENCEAIYLAYCEHHGLDPLRLDTAIWLSSRRR